MSQSSPKPLRIEVLGVSLLFVLCAWFYGQFDPNEIRVHDVFPWDSSDYARMAAQLGVTNLHVFSAPYPFGPRILFPFIYGNLSFHLNIPPSQAAYFVNLACTWVVAVWSFCFWRGSGLRAGLCWVGIVLFFVLWSGPLRGAGVYPGGGFGVELCLGVLTFFLASRKGSAGLLACTGCVLLAFLAACGREYTTYVLLLVLVSRLFAGFLRSKYRQGLEEGSVSAILLDRVCARNVWFLSLLVGASLSGYVACRLLVQDSGSSYSMLRHIRTFGWFHLNLGEVLYVLFYTLGVFFLVLIPVLMHASSRRRWLHSVFAGHPHADLLLLFGLAGLFFAAVGGTDSDRFLMWFFPIYALFGFTAYQLLLESSKIRQGLLGGFLLVCAFFWTRCYVPSLPHLFFPRSAYSSYLGVCTNYDPALFYGPGFMERFRRPLKQIPAADAFTGRTVKEPLKMSQDQAPWIPVQTEKYTISRNLEPVDDAYEFSLNYYPFPLGYMHNQWELLVAHPYHGCEAVRQFLLVQWLACAVAIVWLTYPGLRSLASGVQESKSVAD